MKRLFSVVAGLLLVLAGLIAGAPQQAAAATYCGTSGTLGAPKIVNYGGASNPITLYSSSGAKHQVYYGHPQYFCPAKVHVNFNRDVYVWCNQNSPIFWYTAWGNHAMKTYCAGFHSSYIRFTEPKD